jgi:hypothetical protein
MAKALWTCTKCAAALVARRLDHRSDLELRVRSPANSRIISTLNKPLHKFDVDHVDCAHCYQMRNVGGAVCAL